MSVTSSLARSHRRTLAAPGGTHDRLIAFFIKALPVGIGLIAAIMIVAPLAQREEVSLLLDRNKVAVTDHRIAISTAAYRGRDDNGRPFSLTAGSAVQPSLQQPIVEMRHLAASLELSDGPAEITALAGAYNFDTGRVVVPGPVNVIAPGGYRLITNDVDIDLQTHRLLASGGVQGELSTGTFSANTMMADLEARTITLQGNVRMRMTPGKLSFPK